jgi:hypothetical protein
MLNSRRAEGDSYGLVQEDQATPTPCSGVQDVRLHYRIDEKVKEFLMSLKLGEDQYILEIEGKPFAGLVAPAQAEKMVRAKENLFKAIDKIWKRNKDVSAKKMQKDIADAVQAVRH